MNYNSKESADESAVGAAEWEIGAYLLLDLWLIIGRILGEIGG